MITFDAKTRPSASFLRLPAGVLTLLLFLAGCGDGTAPVTRDVVERVEVTAPATELEVGNTLTVSANASTAGGRLLARSFEWNSSDPTVATVDGDGVVTGVDTGTAVITATTGEIAGQLALTVFFVPEVETLELREVTQPQFRYLDLSTNTPDSVRVQYWREDAEGPVMEVRSFIDGSGTVPLARLVPGATYRVSATPLTERIGVASRTEAGSLEEVFTTDPLPEDLARLDFTATGTPTQPLSVLEIFRSPGGFEGVVVVDAEGAVVWWAREKSTGGTRRANGNFVFGVAGFGPAEFAVDGTLVHSLQHDQHHDVIRTPHNTIYYIATDTRTVDGVEIVGEAIWEWDPEAGTNTRRWSAWDHYSWPEDQGEDSRESDWLHANAISIGPDGDVLMSLRFVNQVVSISPDFQSVNWKLGGTNPTITTDESAEFWGQHTASQLPSDGNTRVLLFDNGEHARGFSRALELELNEEAGTATKVWEFVPPNSNHSFIVSLARRLENGNTYVAFGAGPGVLASTGPVEAYEVTPSGEVVWHLTVGGPDVGDQFVMYRAWPTGSLAGETAVMPGG